MERYIVFGMGPAGLFLTRQLKRAGFIVYGIGKEDDIGRYSNCLECYYSAEDIDSIKSIVLSLKKQKFSLKAYVCSDQYLTMFIEKWIEVFDILNFEEPGKELLWNIADKEKLIEYCRSIGVRFPEEYASEFDSDKIHFPVVIKPNIKRGNSPIKKVTLITNIAELKTFLDYAREKGLNENELIIQQFITGNNKFEYGYGGYFKKGVPVVDVTFMQLRQFPQGISCFACEIEDESKVKDIRELVKPFIEATHYNGFLQFDIKEDMSTGILYVLDINPRPWGSISILGPKCNTHTIFDNDNFGTSEKIYWRFPFKELFSFKNKRNVSYSDIRIILGKRKWIRVIDIFDSRDKKPFFMQIPVAVKKCFKRVIRY